MVSAAPDHLGAASSAIPLARILADRTDTASHEEAIALYRRVASRAPLTTVGRESARAAIALLPRLPPERRLALRGFSPEQRFASANAYMQSRRFEQAETEFQELAASLPETSPLRCEALLNQGRAILRRRAREQGALHMDHVVEECRDGSVVAAALYNAARAHARRGRHQEAIRRYERVARDFPDNSLGDDALYRAALLVEDHEGEPAALRRLEEIPARFPDGDMRTKIQFRLAWIHFEAGRYPQAEEILSTALSNEPLETAEDIRGRLAYWRARVIAEQGRNQEAVEAYTRLFRQWPLSYYAQQSLARLRELSPATAQSLISELRDNDPTRLRFAWRREFEDPAFLRAVELLKVGETDLAEDELSALGFLAADADEDLVWVVVALLHRADSLPRSSRLARTRLQSFHTMIPTGRARNLWRIAYPNAFSPLLDDIARAANVPPTFVRAVAREESAFNPRAVSVAHAYGLIQLIPPTARRFARPLGLPATREALFDPETNLRIGSNYISFLRETYSQNYALVPAGYNAGHGAVNRWLRARRTQPLDQFIENIPYDETRRYSRRVLQTYGVYAWLDEGQLPELKRTLPE